MSAVPVTQARRCTLALAHSAGDEHDLALSGAGLRAALLALAAGATGTGEAAGAAAVGATGADAGRALADLHASVTACADVAHAVALWSRAPVLDAFRTALPTVTLASLDDDVDLDAWVRDHTRGLLDRFPIDVTPDTQVALADAIAAVASWRDPFDPARTEVGEFSGAEGATSPAAFMHRLCDVGHLFRVGGTAVVQIPCAPDDSGRYLVMRFGLGEVGRPLVDVLDDVVGEMDRTEAARVDLRLPRFAARSTLDVRPVLGAMGAAAWTGDDGALLGITGEPLVVTDAVQDAVVEIDEVGVRAAAVTAIGLARGAIGAPPPIVEITFDRPFAYALVDPVTGTPLFAGWISTPSPPPTPEIA